MFSMIFALLLQFKASFCTRVKASSAIKALLIVIKLLPRDAAASLKSGFAAFIVAVLLALNGFASRNPGRRSTGSSTVDAA